ncbi:hypothetical protein [Mycolicibacterium arenosum]|uniref:Glycosyltransferase RgtA/B/C/D-like domain-containing protein n=1 Tax=Mycolicibacterium arenosum TaxID=2952157 RepID=A0ABT1M4K0_9MYCO|nr:hypothetical protein [Mycolicibacterium sp. CAU 1645]MCP9273800.1 hypothetical protein [Mycolicibacterium sp. CAU 1645]
MPVVLAGVYIWRAHGAVPPEIRFSDDFFYYVVPSTNWVDGNGSSFFPGEATNGYHPLWFLWLALLALLTGRGSVYFAAVDLSILALLIGFFFCFERFLHAVTRDRVAAVVGASISAVGLSSLATAGVETALAVFSAALLLAFIARKPVSAMTDRDALIAGLLGAFMVLSRLDSLVLFALIAIVVMPSLDWRRRGALGVGALPVGVYMVFNVVTYGHVATSSMAAKTLTLYWPPNIWFLSHPSPLLGLVIVTAVVLVAAAIVVLVRGDDRTCLRRVCAALAVAPLLQLGAQAVGSGWALFPWYFYLFGMGCGLATALVVARLRAGDRRRKVALPLALAALLLMGVRLVLGSVTPDQWQVDIAAIAERLKAFAADHPGVYAMGDAAGTPAWQMRQPVVHLEGLMMSAEFLDRIRDRDPLGSVFRAYDVDYYVTVRFEGAGGSCVFVTEPNFEQSSPRAPRMAKTICAKPVLAAAQGENYELRVYRVDPATGDIVG